MTGARPKPHASEGVTPTQHTGNPRGRREIDAFMAWFTPGPRSPTVSRPVRWIIHTDGLVACPGSCRRYRTAPLRLFPVRPPVPARSRGMPGWLRVKARGGTQACGSAGRRRRVAVLCLTVGPAPRTRRRRVDAHRRADRHDRVDPPDCRRRAGGAVLPCCRETARGPALMDNPGVLPLRASGQGRGPGNAVNPGRTACCGGVGGPAAAAHHQVGLQTTAAAAR